ncbi:MAG: UvrD-helicase domain-containing protein, partial [bacterium]|nr:UvrD-helicase domain-containing protein [bacterium]
MPRWTKEQEQAIHEEGTNIIVSAGAGSGKTAVLSERALRIVSSGVDVDRLLILTFTKAAAY